MQHASGKDYDPSEWAKQRQERIKRALQVRAGCGWFSNESVWCSVRERKKRRTWHGYPRRLQASVGTLQQYVHCCKAWQATQYSSTCSAPSYIGEKGSRLGGPSAELSSFALSEVCTFHQRSCVPPTYYDSPDLHCHRGVLLYRLLFTCSIRPLLLYVHVACGSVACSTCRQHLL